MVLCDVMQSLVALSKKDSWLFWWSLYLSVCSILALKDIFPLHVYVLCSDHSLEYQARSRCHEVLIQHLMPQCNILIGNRLLVMNAS